MARRFGFIPLGFMAAAHLDTLSSCVQERISMTSHLFAFLSGRLRLGYQGSQDYYWMTAIDYRIGPNKALHATVAAPGS
jgi:hypothetical protein